MNIAIIGFGREGTSALAFLKKQKKYKKSTFWILDKNAQIAASRGVRTQTGKTYLDNLNRFDLIVRSPGVPYTSPAMQSAIKAGATITSATKLFFEHCPAHTIGITGTKGKTTTATILFQILKKAGMDAYLAGNVGKPMLDILSRLTKKSWVVLELSSFQLQDLEQSPNIAGITEVFPDHLDVHKNLAEYQTAKGNIAKHQTEKDAVFFLEKNKTTSKLARLGKGTKYPVNEKNFIVQKNIIKIPGNHTAANINLASRIAQFIGVKIPTIEKIVKQFKGVDHRLQFIRAIKKNKKIIEFYNDSASTNPGSAEAAIEAFREEKNILIAGGSDKKLSFKPLAKTLEKSKNCTAVMLYGQNAKKIKTELQKIKRPLTIKEIKTLAEATTKAYALAQGSDAQKIAIILSPASASFDQFKNYADRGNTFKKIVKNLT